MRGWDKKKSVVRYYDNKYSQCPHCNSKTETAIYAGYTIFHFQDSRDITLLEPNGYILTFAPQTNTRLTPPSGRAVVKFRSIKSGAVFVSVREDISYAAIFFIGWDNCQVTRSIREPKQYIGYPSISRIPILKIRCSWDRFILILRIAILMSTKGRTVVQRCWDSTFIVRRPLNGDFNYSSYPYFIKFLITVSPYWARWRLKSSASPLFTQPFLQAHIKENIKAPRHWPLWAEFTDDRWIPRTKGQ